LHFAIKNSLLVGAGGFVGSVMRYLIASFFKLQSQHIPIGTLAANFLACYIIGIFCHTMPIGRALNDSTKLFLAMGFCGGLSTASSVVQQASTMHRTGSSLQAACYLGLTLVLTFAAFYAGLFTSKLIVKH